MGIELVLNGANINFVAFAHYIPAFEVEGMVFALFVIVLAAAEAAVALAIVLNFYNNHLTVDVDTAEELLDLQDAVALSVDDLSLETLQLGFLEGVAGLKNLELVVLGIE